MSSSPSPTRSISIIVSLVTGAVLLDLSYVLSRDFIEPLGDPFRLLIVWTLYGVSFAYIIAGILGVSDERFTKRLAWTALAILTLAMGAAFADRLSYESVGTDAILFTRYSVDLTLSGDNPYAHSMAPAFDLYAANEAFVTHTEDGGRVLSLSYPALSFLPFIPQVLAGIDNVNVTPVVVLLVVVWVLVRESPSQLASAPIALIFANLSLVHFSFGGVFDILWVLPLIFAMRAWARQRWRTAAVLFGLACAVKQTPWLIAPFLGVWLYLESPDRRTFLRRARTCLTWGLGAFLLPNLPFLISDPGAWLRGVLTPLGSSAPLVMQGQGLTLLEASGVENMSRSFFTVVLALMLAASLALYVVYFARLRWFAWIAPMLLTWFYARSLQNYFIYFVPVAYYAFLLGSEHQLAVAGETTSGVSVTTRWPWLAAPRTRSTLALGIAAATVVGVIVAAVAIGGASRFEGSVRLTAARDPAEIGRITELELSVTNTSGTPLEPLFDLVRQGHQTRFVWEVVSGPEVLAANQIGDYRIGVPVPAASLLYEATFIVTVRDRSSRRTLKSDPLIVERPSDAAHLIGNPSFSMWESPTLAKLRNPIGWTTTTSEVTPVTRVAEVADGVELVSGGVTRTGSGPWTMVGLSQQIPSPRELHLDLTPGTVLPSATVTPRAATGVEIADQHRRVWIVPADVASQTTRFRGGDLDYVFVFVPARPGERLVTTVDLEAIYHQRGWPWPESAGTRRGRRVNLLLFAAVYPGEDAHRQRVQVVFHRIEAE